MHAMSRLPRFFPNFRLMAGFCLVLSILAVTCPHDHEEQAVSSSSHTCAVCKLQHHLIDAPAPLQVNRPFDSDLQSQIIAIQPPYATVFHFQTLARAPPAFS
jgi:hypothetical protein